MQLSVLASGSSGNAAVVTSGETRLLIDAGISYRDLCGRLAGIGVDPESLTACLVTHEHGDHSKAVPDIARKLRIPIYLTRGTAHEIEWTGSPELFLMVDGGADFQIGTISVKATAIPHDALAPVCYALRSLEERIGIATDLGFIPESAREVLADCSTLLLESSYDEDKLRNGDRHPFLKRRIDGALGHLSNRSVAEFIREHLTDRTKRLVLGHISKECNTPELVKLNAMEALSQAGLTPSLETV